MFLALLQLTLHCVTIDPQSGSFVTVALLHEILIEMCHNKILNAVTRLDNMCGWRMRNTSIVNKIHARRNEHLFEKC